MSKVIDLLQKLWYNVFVNTFTKKKQRTIIKDDTRMKKEHLIPVISSIILCCILIYLKIQFFTPEVPDTLIGLSGLESAKEYLTKLIISDIVFALLIALSFFISFVVYYYRLYSSPGEKSEKKFLILSIPVVLVLGLCTTTTANKLDKQCELIGISKHGLTKSIVLLNQINKDIKEDIAISNTVTNSKVSEEIYHYSSGRSSFSEKEYCFKSDSKTIISQVSEKDSLVLKLIISKSENIRYETYLESHFLKSVQIVDGN